MLKKILLVVIIGALVSAYITFGGQRYLSVDFFGDLYAQQPLLTAAVYFAIYVIATAVSIPGAALLTIIGGMVFGLWTGTLLVSFASSIGATLAFLASRFLLRDWVQGKFGERLRAVDDGLEKDGAFYLFTLRLIPVFPFFVINLLMGLTRIKTGTFFWVSQIGMLPATIVFVNAGTQISRIESTAGLLSPTLIASFVALAFFPWAAKGIVAVVKRSRG